MKKYHISAIDSVTDEIVKAFKNLIPQLSPTCRIPNKEDLELIVNSEDSVLLIAKDDKIIGTLTLVINRIPSGMKVWIEDVVVDISARGKGVGKELIIFAIDYAEGLDADSVNLTSRTERVAANELYKKLGFIKRETNVYRLCLNKK